MGDLRCLSKDEAGANRHARNGTSVICEGAGSLGTASARVGRVCWCGCTGALPEVAAGLVYVFVQQHRCYSCLIPATTLSTTHGLLTFRCSLFSTLPLRTATVSIGSGLVIEHCPSKRTKEELDRLSSGHCRKPTAAMENYQKLEKVGEGEKSSSRSAKPHRLRTWRRLGETNLLTYTARDLWGRLQGA